METVGYHGSPMGPIGPMGQGHHGSGHKSGNNSGNGCETKLDIENSECGNAFECSPGWNLEKTIKKCGKKEKKVKVCIFKHDVAKVTYNLCATREDSGQVCFTWPITVTNSGHHDTEKLKVGVKAYLVDCDGKKTKVCIFEDFEKVKPCLKPKQCHQYILNGCFIPKCGIEDKKLKLVSCVTIANSKCDMDQVAVVLKINDNCHNGKNEVAVVDKDLGFCEIIDHSKSIHVKALFTPGSNIECCKPFHNVAKLHHVENNDCDKHDCNHLGCGKIGKSIAQKDCDNSEKASFTVDCANISLNCNLNNSCCIDNWCLCQTSKVCDNSIEYTISAKKSELSGASCCLDAVVCLDGCIPEYKKEFCLTLYKIGKDHDDKHVIAQEKFTLGGTSKGATSKGATCKGTTSKGGAGKGGAGHGGKKKKTTYKWKNSTKKIPLSHSDSGKFVFVLSYGKQVYNVESGTAEYLDCDPVVCTSIQCCKDDWNTQKALLKNDFHAPSGRCGEYKIKNLGSFSSDSELKKFLYGNVICLTKDKEICFELCFPHLRENSARVTNVVKLESSGTHSQHKNSTVSCVEDCLNKASDKDECDSRDDDCDEKSKSDKCGRKKHTKKQKNHSNDSCESDKGKRKKEKSCSESSESSSSSSSSSSDPCDTGTDLNENVDETRGETNINIADRVVPNTSCSETESNDSKKSESCSSKTSTCSSGSIKWASPKEFQQSLGSQSGEGVNGKGINGRNEALDSSVSVVNSNVYVPAKVVLPKMLGRQIDTIANDQIHINALNQALTEEKSQKRNHLTKSHFSANNASISGLSNESIISAAVSASIKPTRFRK